jgi:hypothetical protein
MKISQFIKQTATTEYTNKPLQYLLTLPPMSKILATREDNERDYFTIFGKKGLYEFADKKDLTMKELIDLLPDKEVKYRFEIEFEEAPHDYVSEAKTLQSIIQRNPKPELIDKLKEVTLKTNSPSLCYDYAKNVIKGRWPEAEPIIAQDPEYVPMYAKNMMNGKRWSEGEIGMLKSDHFDRNFHLCKYAQYIIKGRWPEAERLLLNGKKLYRAGEYAADIIGGRWQLLEQEILKTPDKMDTGQLILYCNECIGGRWSELERNMLRIIDYHTAFDETNSQLNSLRYLAYDYVKEVIKGPWPEIERYLSYDGGLYRKYKQITKSFEIGMGSTVNLHSRSLSQYLKHGEEFLKKFRGAKYVPGKYMRDMTKQIDLSKEIDNIPPHHQDGFLLYFANCQMNGASLPDPAKIRKSTLEKWKLAKDAIDKMRSEQNVG